MTMQYSIHPDEERLAALAGDDADALGDAALAAHVASCARCGPVLSELRTLRSSLSELPDLRPSRPLRLLPPVSAAQRPAPWWRRLAAPALAAGAGLVLVGAIGFSGLTNGLENLASGMAAGAGASMPAERENDAAASQVPALASGDAYEGGEVTGQPVPRQPGVVDKHQPPPAPDDDRTAWLLAIAGGAVLLGGGLGLRSASRRSGPV